MDVLDKVFSILLDHCLFYLFLFILNIYRYFLTFLLLFIDFINLSLFICIYFWLYYFYSNLDFMIIIMYTCFTIIYRQFLHIFFALYTNILYLQQLSIFFSFHFSVAVVLAGNFCIHSLRVWWWKEEFQWRNTSKINIQCLLNGPNVRTVS